MLKSRLGFEMWCMFEELVKRCHAGLSKMLLVRVKQSRKSAETMPVSTRISECNSPEDVEYAEFFSRITSVILEQFPSLGEQSTTTTTTNNNNNAETSKTITTKNQWQGGVLVGKVIYAMPCNSRTILKINPGSNGPNSPPIVSEIGSGVIPSGRCKWQGGFLSESDGCIYGTFVHIHCILQKQYCF